MNAINDAYVNALLADATYALDDTAVNEYPKADLIEKLAEQMTPTLAEFIGNNFTVVTHKETNDAFSSGFDATVWKDKSGKTYVSMTGSTPRADFLADIDLEKVAA